MAIDIGRIAYQAYIDSLISCIGNPPAWEVLGKSQQDAWRHAAVAVLQYIDGTHEEDISS